MSTNYGDWQNDIEQLQRAAASRTSKIKKGIVGFDRNQEWMLIQGSASEPYKITLDGCTCADYAIRGLPCKHMYALAFELGMMTDFPTYREGRSHEDIQGDIDRYYDFFMQGKIKADDYVKLYKVLAKM